jgi:hypothetical protein
MLREVGAGVAGESGGISAAARTTGRYRLLWCSQVRSCAFVHFSALLPALARYQRKTQHGGNRGDDHKRHSLLAPTLRER